MPLNFNGNSINLLNFNDTEINFLYMDGTLVWASTSVDLSGIPTNIYSTANGAAYYLYADGTHSEYVDNTEIGLSPDWLVGVVPEQLELYMTVISGTLDGASSPTGQWIPVGNYQWRNVIPAPSGDATVELNLRFRRVTTQEVIADKNFSIRVDF